MFLKGFCKCQRVEPKISIKQSLNRVPLIGIRRSGTCSLLTESYGTLKGTGTLNESVKNQDKQPELHLGTKELSGFGGLGFARTD